MASPVYDTATDQISSAGNNGIFTIGLSGGAASEGDLVMAALYIESDEVITLPSGWAEIRMAEQNSGSGAFRLYTWYKVAGASEPATYDFDFAGTLWIHGAIWKVTGQNADPIHLSTSAVSSGADTTSEPVELETTVTDCLLIHVASNFAGGAWTADAGDGFTEQLDNSANITVGTKQVTSAGLSGSIVATCAGSGTNAGILIAVKSTTSVGAVYGGTEPRRPTVFAPGMETPMRRNKLIRQTWAGTVVVEEGEPVLVTPGTASLVLTSFTPTVLTPRLVTPGTASLVTARFTPSVILGTRVIPGTASLALTAFTPTVLTPRLVIPGIGTLVLEAQTPTVRVGKIVVPGTASLVLSSFSPTVLTPRLVTPGTASLVLAAQTPKVGIGYIPGTATLVLAGFAPTVLTPRLVTPGTAALVLTAFAPDAFVTDADAPVAVIILVPSGKIAKRLTDNLYLEL